MKAAILQKLLASHSDDKNSSAMSAYMKNRFSFFGIKSQLRRELLREYMTAVSAPESNSELKTFVLECWSFPQREMHYCGLEVLIKNQHTWDKDDLDFFENLIVTDSWWDSVDLIAPKIIGTWFKLYPEHIKPTIDRWLQSDNIWLQRSCLLFQLKYKDKTNTQLLTTVIDQLKESKEFFIRKAIGWVLREYAKTDAEFVKEFVNSQQLSPLSQREALKHF